MSGFFFLDSFVDIVCCFDVLVLMLKKGLAVKLDKIPDKNVANLWCHLKQNNSYSVAIATVFLGVFYFFDLVNGG
jgi:hypothetical protein